MTPLPLGQGTLFFLTRNLENLLERIKHHPSSASSPGEPQRDILHV